MKALVLSIAIMAISIANTFAITENPGEPAVANTCISGVIVDQNTGEALTGVEVKLNGTDTKTYTDFDGKFVFDKVKPGNYSVETNIISYQPVVRSINVDTNELHALNLQLDNVGDE
jgi:hypothetical protein